MVPKNTRLRWAQGSDPETLVKYCESLPYRVHIYSIVFNGTDYVLFFVPDDKVQVPMPHGKIKITKGTKK
jgi:hypothetical protein